MEKQTRDKTARGFTLLELLIVIAIIAILSVILVLVLNPAETLRKSRDAQRISDLSTVKTALGLYLTSTSSPYLGSASSNARCSGGATPTIFYSVSGITDTAAGGFNNISSSSATAVDSTGWIPVNLASLTGGSPLSNFPLDPVNSVTTGSSTAGALTNSAQAYRYACKSSPLTFEINATLESTAYTSEDNKLTKDGGNNSNLYEVGTDLNILPATDDF